MTRVLSFDQAMAVTGWAFGTENSSPREGANDRYHYGVIKTPKRDDVGERLAILWRETSDLIMRFEPDIIGYEEPYFPHQGAGGTKHRQHFRPAHGFLPAEIDEEQEDEAKGSRFNPEMLKQLQMVKGLVVTQAALRGVPCFGCTPSQWRKTLLGFGRKPKGESDDFMKKRVKRHLEMMGFDLAGYSHDVSDAIGICHHTLHGPEATERKQGDLLSMVSSTL